MGLKWSRHDNSNNNNKNNDNAEITQINPLQSKQWTQAHKRLFQGCLCFGCNQRQNI